MTQSTNTSTAGHIDAGDSPADGQEVRVVPITGVIVPAPTFPITDVTGWTDEELNILLESDEMEIEAWRDSTVEATA